MASQPEGTTHEIEKQLVENLKNTCAFVQVKSLISEPGDWQKLEDQLDIIIEENVRIARLSHSKGEKTENEETTVS